MRSERSQNRLIGAISHISQWPKDADNLPNFASRHGYEFAYRALKLQQNDGTYQIQDRGYYHVRKGGLWGVVDAKGRLLLPCVYDDIDYVYGNMAMCVVPVKKGGKWGCHWFYPKGFEGLPCEYDDVFMDALSFPDSVGCIKDGKEGLFCCHSLRWNVPVEYDKLRKAGNWDEAYPPLIAYRDGKYGVIKSIDNTIVVPIEYDRIYMSHGVCYAEKDGVSTQIQLG